jgi:hypothetical protein
MNQALLAVPIVGLYQVGIGAVWVANRPRKGDQFADGETRAALMALKNRRMAESWYGPYEGKHTLHCRWTGQYDGESREILTVVVHDLHYLLPISENRL